MDDTEFDNNMNDWITNECRSAPLLRPTKKMREMVMAKRGERSRYHPRPRSRWIPIGVAAAAAVVMLVVLFPGLNPFSSGGGTAGGTVALREWSADGVEFIGVRPGGGRGAPRPKGPTDIIQQLVYQYHQKGTANVVGLEIAESGTSEIFLKPGDEYRLTILPAVDLDVMVLQVRSDGEIVDLLHNEAEPRAPERISKAELRFVPNVSNWFYLTEQAGEERILVVASTLPMRQLEETCRAYFGAEKGAARAELGRRLLDEIESIRNSKAVSGGVWDFSFN